MNIFLTGEKGVGKSTVIDRVLEELSDCAGGFRTWFDGDRTAPDKRLVISDLRKSAVRTAVRFHDNRPEADISAFDGFGAGLVRAGGRLVVMDELGKFEGGCDKFREAVRAALDSDTPVLGVMQAGVPSWADELGARQDLRIITVTRENRDNLPEEILAVLKAVVG